MLAFRCSLALSLALPMAPIACTARGTPPVDPDPPPPPTEPTSSAWEAPSIEHMGWAAPMLSLATPLVIDDTPALLHQDDEGLVLREMADGTIRWRHEGPLGFAVPYDATNTDDVATWWSGDDGALFVGLLQRVDGALAWQRSWSEVGGGAGFNQPVVGLTGRGLALWRECAIIPLDRRDGRPLCGAVKGQWVSFDDGIEASASCMVPPTYLGQFGADGLVLGRLSSTETKGLLRCAQGAPPSVVLELPDALLSLARWSEPGVLMAKTETGVVAVRLDKTTGQVRWIERVEHNGAEPPDIQSIRVATVGDETLVLMQAGPELVARAVEDGSVRFRAEVGDAWALVETERSFAEPVLGRLHERSYSPAIQWVSPNGTPTARVSLESEHVPYLAPEGVVVAYPEGLKALGADGRLRWSIAEAPVHALYRVGPWLVAHAGPPGEHYDHFILDAETGTLQQRVPDVEWFFGGDARHLAFGRREPSTVFTLEMPAVEPTGR